jgi:hypothetical protein
VPIEPWGKIKKKNYDDYDDFDLIRNNYDDFGLNYRKHVSELVFSIN